MLSVVVGRPGRGVEYFVLDADDHPRRVDRAAQDALGERDPWVTVPTSDPWRTADRLAEHGLRTPAETEWLMGVRLLDQRRGALAEGYTTELVGGPDVLRLRVLGGDGEPAATGQISITDDLGVPDRIQTVQAHRRRGIGAAMMTVLVDAAVAAGAAEGLLMASTRGRALYTSLGWHTLGPVVIGRLWD